MREEEDAGVAVLVVLIARGNGGVHGCWNDEGGAGHCHKGRHGRCDGSVEGLLATAEAASDETASENLGESASTLSFCKS